METDSLADEDAELSRSNVTERSTSFPLEAPGAGQDAKILYKKYVRSVNEMRKLRDRITELEKLNAKIVTVLQKEVGSAEDVSEALENKESNWRGRAEEILDLRKRVKELSAGPSSQPNVAVVVDQRKTTELQTKLDNVSKELTDCVTMKRSMRARIDQLEMNMRTARTDIKTLLEKDELNCRLIEELTEKINTFS